MCALDFLCVGTEHFGKSNGMESNEIFLLVDNSE